ncbi:MAG: hypothetical protein ACOC0O_07690 [Spirochaetota bacterium]
MGLLELCRRDTPNRLDYHRFSRNRELDSSNNQITDGWVAVAGPERGLLVAYNRMESASIAFCPVSTRFRGRRQEIRLNPSGTYAGRQWHYPSSSTGPGRFIALRMADQLDSYAASYAGRRTGWPDVVPRGRSPNTHRRHAIRHDVDVASARFGSLHHTT